MLAILLCSLVMVISLINWDTSGGWRAFEIRIFLFVSRFLVFGFTDFLLRLLLKKNVLQIWLAEMLITGFCSRILFTEAI